MNGSIVVQDGEVSQSENGIGDLDTWVRHLMRVAEVVEVRVPGTGWKASQTIGGYFDNPEVLSAAIRWLDGRTDEVSRRPFTSIYSTLNAFSKDLFYRSPNRFDHKAKTLVQDADVTRRLWLPMDVDAGQATGIMSSTAEHDAAVDGALAVADWLADRDWPEGLLADSGNGGHNLCRIDMPNDDEHLDIVTRALASVAKQFPHLKVDTTVVNAARVWKVYGTRVCKGFEGNPERPHRRAKIISGPEQLAVVPTQLVRELADLVPAVVFDMASRPSGVVAFDQLGFLAKHKINVKWEKPHRKGGVTRIIDRCPLHGEDANGSEIAVYQMDDGVLGFQCKHARCQGKTWKDFREALDPIADRPTAKPDVMARQEEQVAALLAAGQQATNGTALVQPPEADVKRPVRRPTDRVITLPDASAINLTDIGNARLFQLHYGDDLRYVVEWKGWIAWTGVYWEQVPTERVIADYVQPLVRNTMWDMGKSIDDMDQRKKWASWTIQSNSAAKVRALLEMAAPALSVTVSQLNTNADLFACRNAVIDLTTCDAVPPDRNDLVTVHTDVEFDPDAKCPSFSAFVGQVMVEADGSPSPDLAGYMQRLLGHCLTPSTAEQSLYVASGTGQNGKSTLFEVALGVLGQ